MQIEKSQILENVHQLFFKYGIKSLTMDDIARELGISKKTLYQFVTDKTDLVKKVLNYDSELRKKEFEAIFTAGKNAIEELVEVQQVVHEIMCNHNPATFFDLKKYYPDLYRSYLEDKFKFLHQYILENLIKGKEQGYYRNDLNEIIISKHTALRIFQMILTDMLDIHEFTSDEYFTEILIYHIRGIASEKGLAILELNMPKILKYKNKII